MTEYYKEKLEQGLQYQDFVTDLLLKEIALPISSYASREYQAKKGENAQGVEIKCDSKMAETGNIYIEVAEKTHPDNPAFVPSGMYRADNTWLYVIGDYTVVYIFSKKFLRLMHETGKYPSREAGPPGKKPTSKGFLLSKAQTERYCIKSIQISQEIDWKDEGVV